MSEFGPESVGKLMQLLNNLMPQQNAQNAMSGQFGPMVSGNIPAYQGIFQVGYIDNLGPFGNMALQYASKYATESLIPKITGIPGSLSTPLFGRHNMENVLYDRAQFSQFEGLNSAARYADTESRRNAMANLAVRSLGLESNTGIDPWDNFVNARARGRARDKIAPIDSIIGQLPFGIAEAYREYFTPGGQRAPMAEALFRTSRFTTDVTGRRADPKQLEAMFKSLDNLIAPGDDARGGLGFSYGLRRGEIGGVMYELGKRGLSFVNGSEAMSESGAFNKFENSKYKETLQQYNKVARGLVDLFGGKDMSELMANLDKLTAGGAAGSDPQKLERMITNITGVNRITGVSQQEIMRRMSEAAAIGVQSGIGGVAGAEIAQAGILAGKDAFFAGKSSELSMNQQQWTDIQTRRRLAGAGSEASKRLGGILLYASRDGELDDATQKLIKTYTDPNSTDEQKMAAGKQLMFNSAGILEQMSRSLGSTELAYGYTQDPDAALMGAKSGSAEVAFDVQLDTAKAVAIKELRSMGLSSEEAASMFDQVAGIRQQNGESYEEALKRTFGRNSAKAGQYASKIGEVYKTYDLSLTGRAEDVSRQYASREKGVLNRDRLREYADFKDMIQKDTASKAGISTIFGHIDERLARGGDPGDIIGTAFGVLQGSMSTEQLMEEFNKAKGAPGQTVQHSIYKTAKSEIASIDEKIKEIEKKYPGDENKQKRDAETAAYRSAKVRFERDMATAKERFTQYGGEDIDNRESSPYADAIGGVYKQQATVAQLTKSLMDGVNPLEGYAENTVKILQRIYDAIIEFPKTLNKLIPWATPENVTKEGP
jgi:hypothetical protein